MFKIGPLFSRNQILELSYFNQVIRSKNCLVCSAGHYIIKRNLQRAINIPKPSFNLNLIDRKLNYCLSHDQRKCANYLLAYVFNTKGRTSDLAL